ncbi:MAG: MBL fold metallo-hydrolase [Fibrobacter sp.]|nr:MBL fold metallo-hydrolase [Fibrobacter sp.]
MINNFKATILVDNKPNPDNSSLLSEHGLSIWIEVDSTCILFDTGQSHKCIENALTLGIDLSRAEYLILSHGHYDHTGALDAALQYAPQAKIYCHPDCTITRYSHYADGTVKNIAIREHAQHTLNEHAQQITYIKSFNYITDSFGIITSIPRNTSFENTGGIFSIDLKGDITDTIPDDLSLFFLTSRGIVLVCGCCHSGIINTMYSLQQNIPDTPIASIIGGLHLVNASKVRLSETISRLEKVKVPFIYPCHCTGDIAASALHDAHPERVVPVYTGYSITV